MIKNRKVEYLLRFMLIALSACVYAFFFKVIVEGRGFLSMGASGVAVILSRVINKITESDIESILYMIFYLGINLPLLIFGYKKISKKFILVTLIYVAIYSIVVGFIPSHWGEVLGFNELDDLTSAILIGLVSGLSCIGALVAGGCAGGLGILSSYLNVKKGKGVGTYNLIFNTSVIFMGFLVFRDVPSIIYTLFYAFFSSLIVDKYYNKDKKILLEIVTTKKEEVCNYLLEHSHHGCTIIEAKGAYTNENKQVIHTAISFYQLKSMIRGIKRIDEHSFVIELSIHKVYGGFYMPQEK